MSCQVVMTSTLMSLCTRLIASVPAHGTRRSSRSRPPADPASAVSALVGAATAGRLRPRVRARLHRALDLDPDPDQAGRRQGDRGAGRGAAAPLPRRDHPARVAALRRQLHPPLRDRPRRDRRRGPAARDALPRLPHLSPRLLRPARDRRGDLARHQRHLPRSLLHRLGRGAGRSERDDDHGRGDRAHDRECATGALRGAGDAADRDPDVRLRAQALPDLAARPGAQGQPRRGDGRGGRRDRDGAGVRARGRRANALPRARRSGPARDDARGVGRGVLPSGPPLPALARELRPCSSSVAAT